MGELKRLFFGVGIDPEVTEMLARHLSRWEMPGKAVPPDNWHFTVRFLGWTDDVRRDIVMGLVDQADLRGSFRLTLGPIGAFPRPTRAGVVWLGVTHGEPALALLNQVVEQAAQAAGFPPEDRPYAAHLTLARLRPPADVSRLVDAYQPQPFRWRVRELILFESRPGPLYVPLERFAL